MADAGLDYESLGAKRDRISGFPFGYGVWELLKHLCNCFLPAHARMSKLTNDYFGHSLRPIVLHGAMTAFGSFSKCQKCKAP